MIVLKDGARFAGAPNLDPAKIASFVAEGIWAEADLALHGLVLATEFIVPEGKVTTGAERFVQDKDGAWSQEFDVADPPPPSDEEIRLSSFTDDTSRKDLIARLNTASASQIDAWLTSNVTNLAQARTVLGAIIKALAMMGLE